MGEYYFSLSVSELQQWLVDDTLAIGADRFVLFPQEFSQQPNPGTNDDAKSMQIALLLARLPAFALDDSAGVLICKVDEPEKWHPTGIPGVYNLQLANVLEFIPLTQGGFDSLGLRFSSIIKISHPRFETEFVRHRYEIKAKFSKRAGDLLIESLINFGENNFVISEETIKFLPEALKFAEHAAESEPADGVLSHKNWLNLFFGYRRNKPLPNHEIINNIADIGIVLASIEKKINAEWMPELVEFRDKWRKLYNRLKSMRDISEEMLGEIYSDNQLNSLNIEFVKKFSGTNKISLVSMGLFLHWKQRFHNNNSHINFHALISDLNSLADRVDIDDVAIAVWLFGAYLGTSEILPFYRFLHKEKYFVLNFSNDIPELKPINAWKYIFPSSQALVRSKILSFPPFFRRI